MMEKEIDIEKDHLVIWRDMQGNFKSYEWCSAHRKTEAEIKTTIAEINEKNTDGSGSGRQAELITDKFIRNICAYAHKQYVDKRDEIRDERMDIQDTVDKAIETLEDAIYSLNRMKLD